LILRGHVSLLRSFLVRWKESDFRQSIIFAYAGIIGSSADGEPKKGYDHRVFDWSKWKFAPVCTLSSVLLLPSVDPFHLNSQSQVFTLEPVYRVAAEQIEFGRDFDFEGADSIRSIDLFAPPDL
jgi:hypothetical protein